MTQTTNTHNNASPIYLLCILIFTALATSITLIILIYFWGYLGFIGTNPIIIGTSNDNYFTNKYSNIDIIIKIICVGSIVATIMGIIAFFIVIGWVVKQCRGKKQEQNISNCSVVVMYVVVGLMELGAVVPVSYYITFMLELKQCNSTYDAGQLLILFIISASLMLSGLCVWIVLTCIRCRQNKTEMTQQKYKIVQTVPTQPKQEFKRRITYEKSPDRGRPYQYQQTKENIYDSPSRRPIDPKPQIYRRSPKQIHSRNYELQDQLIRNLPPSNDSPIRNLHPDLRPRNKNRLQQSRLDYIPNQNYDQQPHYDELAHSRPRQIRNQGSFMRGEQEEFARERKRYLGENGGPILPFGRGFQQRDRRDRNDRYQQRTNNNPRARNNNRNDEYDNKRPTYRHPDDQYDNYPDKRPNYNHHRNQYDNPDRPNNNRSNDYDPYEETNNVKNYPRGREQYRDEYEDDRNYQPPNRLRGRHYNDPRDQRGISQYLKPTQPRMRHQSPRRDGGLINYARGRYAD